MAPIVHGLESEYSDRMNFVYLDIDDPATTAFKQELGYFVQPNFFLLDGQGNVLKQWYGLVSVEEFVQAFDTALAQ
jgi:thioredoxin-related protein